MRKPNPNIIGKKPTTIRGAPMKNDVPKSTNIETNNPTMKKMAPRMIAIRVSILAAEASGSTPP